MVFCNCLWLVGCCVVKYLPKVPFEKWPQTPSLAGGDGGVQMISRPRISGNWPPTGVGIGSDITCDLELVSVVVRWWRGKWSQSDNISTEKG